MALTPRLDLRPTQALVMTPQLQQAIKLLQMSNVELNTYVEAELQQNPLLERDEADNASTDSGDNGVEAAEALGDTGLESVDRAVANDANLSDETALDVDYDNQFDTDAGMDGPLTGGVGDSALGVRTNRGGSGFDDGETSIEGMASATITLRDHLMAQLRVDVIDPVDRMIGAHLIELLDEAGYLHADLEPVAETLGCEASRVEAALGQLQQLDPAGVFARNLAECLALQLQDRNRMDPAMAAMLDHLDMVARRDIQGLVRVCGVDAEDVADMVAEIRALNPKPALAFDLEIPQPVTPDVIMRPQSDGSWIVELNQETLPRVLINSQYYARLKRSTRNKDDRQYISECLQSANWLVKSLHQRATTILKVATEIVNQQESFFLRGIQELRPLVLRDIAQAIDMHESTVSRVTTNKYMATPRGIFELKFFFTQAINSVDGQVAHSAESVRHRIKSLIDHEPANSVLSDDGIVEALQNEGVDIARRTVAKYRESMGIPSSVRRRREKALQF